MMSDTPDKVPSPSTETTELDKYTALADLPSVLDAPEVALVLRISPKSVRGLLHNQDLPGKKVGGLWRISKMQFISWLEDNEGAA